MWCCFNVMEYNFGKFTRRRQTECQFLPELRGSCGRPRLNSVDKTCYLNKLLASLQKVYITTRSEHALWIGNRLTWYRSKAMAVMDIVETKMLMAWREPIILQMKGLFPRGKCLVRISIKVKGMVTVQRRRSETAKLTINMLRGVLIAGFLTTDTI